MFAPIRRHKELVIRREMPVYTKDGIKFKKVVSFGNGSIYLTKVPLIGKILKLANGTSVRVLGNHPNPKYNNHYLTTTNV